MKIQKATHDLSPCPHGTDIPLSQFHGNLERGKASSPRAGGEAFKRLLTLVVLTLVLTLFTSPLSAQTTDSLDTDTEITTTDTTAVDTPETEPVKSGKGDLKVPEGKKKKKKYKKSVVERSDADRKRDKMEVPPENLGPDGKPKHDPNKAARRSMIVPGWGQIYNGSWWKTPVIYAGFGAVTFFAIDNHRKYKQHRDIVICKLQSSCNDTVEYPDFELYDVASVISIRDFHRRYRDLNIIFGGLWYAIQIIDALVEGHLKEFSVSPDLSMRLKPNINFNPVQRSNLFMGATLQIRLRR